MSSTALTAQQTLPLLLAAVLLLATAAAFDGIRLRRRLAQARQDLESALHDHLTGLLTRDGYLGRAQDAVYQHGDEALVVLLDVNGLKKINDKLGHDAGDALIHAVASRLREWADGRGLAARLSRGDEFSAVIHAPAREHHALLADLAAHVNRPTHWADRALDVSAAIGAATPRTAGTRRLAGQRGLLARADTAMYQAKTGQTPFRIDAAQVAPLTSDHRPDTPERPS